MLEDAYKNVKKNDCTTCRFETPKIEGYYEGKKTIITNFFCIASYIRRDPQHFQKYLLKNLASSGHTEGERLILNIKIPKEKIKQKIEQYINEFVKCKECKKPDTELIKESRLSFVHCLACGAKHPVTLKT